MPRRSTSDSITHILRSAEDLKNRINVLPDEVRELVRILILGIVGKAPRKRKRQVKPPRAAVYA